MAKKTFPTFVLRMMANSVKEPFDSPDWIFEVKLDGYRGIAVFDAAGKPHLWSRKRFTARAKVPSGCYGALQTETAFNHPGWRND
jgi:ATP-dependent DNA ligase